MFFSSYFQYFPFTFVFQKLASGALMCSISCMYPVKVPWTSWIWNWTIFTKKLRLFWPVHLQISFRPHSLFSFSVSESTHVRSLILFHRSLTICSFFYFLFSLPFRLDNSYWFIFIFTDHFFCIPEYFLGPPNEVFILYSVLSSSTNSILKI